MAGLVEVDQGQEEDDNFDPHEHRKVKKPTTDMETFIHLLKGCLGTGLLAMPDAVDKAGLLIGFFGTLVIGIFAVYCIHILIKAQYKLCRMRRVGHIHFSESMKFALLQGPPIMRGSAEAFRFITLTFLILWQIGVCCVYVVFVAANFKQLADFYGLHYDIRIHIVVIAVPIYMMNLISNLKYLAPVSTVANGMTIMGLLFIFFYLVEHDVDFEKVAWIGKPRDYPLYVGTTLFAIEAVGVILALEHNMQNPAHFLGYFGIFNRGMVVIVILYAVVGCLGYATYGSSTASSVTLNLPDNEKKAQAAKFMYALAILLSYPLQSYVAFELIWLKTKKKVSHKWQKTLMVTIQLGIVTITVILAASIPKLGLFISLFGALCLSVLAMILPALLDICVYYPGQYGFAYYRLIRDIIIIIIGLSACVLGTYISIHDIIVSYEDEEP